MKRKIMLKDKNYVGEICSQDKVQNFLKLKNDQLWVRRKEVATHEHVSVTCSAGNMDHGLEPI